MTATALAIAHLEHSDAQQLLVLVDAHIADQRRQHRDDRQALALMRSLRRIRTRLELGMANLRWSP